MARKTNHKFQRNKRERARQERAAARRNRRAKRSEQRGDSADDDLAGIVAGPQAKDKASDDEVLRAVERAMNPGAARQGGRNADGPRAETARLFVGNLDFGTDEGELGEFFKQAGFEVLETRVVKDRATGQPRGFAFVELASQEDAQRAIEELDGSELAGRSLRVNPADRRTGGR